MQRAKFHPLTAQLQVQNAVLKTGLERLSEKMREYFSKEIDVNRAQPLGFVSLRNVAIFLWREFAFMWRSIRSGEKKAMRVSFSLSVGREKGQSGNTFGRKNIRFFVSIRTMEK